MRELYLLGCVVLGAGAVFATMSAVKYDYQFSQVIQEDTKWNPSESNEEDKKENVRRNPDVIFEKNAFEELRGKAVPEDEEVPEVDDTPKGNYSFELRGINIIGEKKVALVTATPVNTGRSSRDSRSRGRTPTPVRSTSSNKVYIVAEGEEVGDTGYKVSSIDAKQVLIADGKGETKSTLVFSLVSDESLKRAEMAYKNEVVRQKTFSKQNSFDEPKTTQTTAKPQNGNNTAQQPAKPADPKQMTKEQREAEMRKRAEKLKEEMKRLKELRESQNKDDKRRR